MSKQMIRSIVAGGVVVLACALGGAASAGRLVSPPAIAGISPASAQPGTTVTITGTGLTGATVTLRNPKSNAPAVTATTTETVVNPQGTQIVLTIPDGSDAAGGVIAPFGVDRLVITTPGGSATALFTVLKLRQAAHGPVITGFTPRRAAPGHTVMITGSNLNGATGVWLSGRKARFKVPSASEILAVVPKHAVSGKWSVKTDVGTASSMRFTVLAPAA